jgi:hypothetical protein
MANRQRDVDLRFAQVSQLEIWLGLAWLCLHGTESTSLDSSLTTVYCDHLYHTAQGHDA